MNEVNEIWRDVIDFEGYYKVSNLGNVLSLIKSISLKPEKTQKGYYRVFLHKPEFRKKMLIHRLVAQSFIPNLENKPFINHINSIRTDNVVENLEWCTQSENVKHGFKHGFVNRNRGLKLSETQAIEIFNSNRHYRELSSEYGVSPATIYDIRSGRSFSWATSKI